MRNINFNATEEDIKEFMSDCGEIDKVFLPQTSNLVKPLFSLEDSAIFTSWTKLQLKKLLKNLELNFWVEMLIFPLLNKKDNNDFIIL